jgi:tetratricopeptide (TPR) repeat protein
VLKNLLKGRKSQNPSLKQTRSKNEVEHFLLDAIVSFEDSDFQVAVQRFELIVKAYPDHPLAHLMLGRAYIELKRYEKAIMALYSHLRIVPNSVEAMIYLGLAYYECNELKIAMEKYQEALLLRSGSLLARENLIITKISAGRLDEALDDLIEIRKEKPDDQDVIELMVLVLGRLGKWEAAKQFILFKGKPQPNAAWSQ